MRNKERLFRLPDGTEAYLQMNSISQILLDKGVTSSGDVQSFHTQNVLRRMIKYMPMRSGMTIKVTIAQTDINRPEIITNTPYAQYLYHGKVMEGKAPKVVTQRDLNFTKTKNPQAGPYWDRALSAAEGDAIKTELQAYIDRRR